MLGPVKKNTAWAWGASGKHPVARDYISIGNRTLMLETFSSWVESGYSKFQDRPAQACSFRFWARGAKGQELICGLIRDSIDTIGRPFPFLVLGTGQLDGWEETWELLPMVFDGLWSRMEYLTTKRSYDLSALESELVVLPHPTLFQGEGTAAGRYEDATEGIENMRDAAELFAPIRGEGFDDPSAALVMWHARLKELRRDAPGSVFMGGMPGNTWLGVFRRPLAAADFVRLWTLG